MPSRERTPTIQRDGVITASMRGVWRRIHAWAERLRSPTASSATARSDARYFRILLTASSAAAAKAVSMVIQLAMVPLMLSALGDYSYGVWLTLQSLIGFGAFADLGIGNGAMNAISAAQARGDHERINRIITSAVAMLTGLAICGMAAAPAAFSWVSGLQFGGSHAPDVAIGIALFTAYFALSLPLGFVERVNAAFQEGAVTNIARCGVAVVTLAATWGVTRAGGSFGAICAATLAPQLLGWAVVWLVEFRRRGWLRVGRRLFDRSLARSLLGVGMLFLGIQVLAAFNWSMDNILISSILGAENVTPYGVQVRVFGLVGTLVSMILTPLWPAYADAVAHGDHAWIRSTLRRSLVGTLAVSVPLAFGAAVALPFILRVWTGGAIQTTPILAYGLASLTVCQTVCGALAMFWNGTSAIRVQFLIGLALVLISVPLKVLVLRSHGIEWLGFLSAGLIVSTVLFPAFFLVRSALAVRQSGEMPTVPL
jgi:O-antigen/teichoic acid export membrane protein